MAQLMLLLCLVSILLVNWSDCIEFSTIGRENNIYRGYVWKGATMVHVRPRIQIIPSESSHNNDDSLCNIVVSEWDSQYPPPFEAVVSDKKHGFVALVIKDNSLIDFSEERTYTLTLKAESCSQPPQYIEANAVIKVVAADGPTLDKPSYRFVVEQSSPVGSVIGQVQALSKAELSVQDSSFETCSYTISPESSLFTIDEHGVIRIRERLDRVDSRAVLFQVLAEDCHRPTPNVTLFSVSVELITSNCQPGWPNLPGDIEYNGDLTSTGRLFKPSQVKLITCSASCLKPYFTARVELKSALKGQQLTTARTKDCMHDPASLLRQRKICRLHDETRTNLLPNPELDIASQLRRAVLGQSPELSAATMSWRFDADKKTVWELDDSHFTVEDSSILDDNEFTLAFWIMRGQTVTKSSKSSKFSSDDNEEAVFCSQDEDHPTWRYLSISLHQCSLFVRLTAQVSPSSPQRQLLTREFGPLPDYFCSPDAPRSWHHLAVTFSRNSTLASTDQPISLMFDGRDAGVPLDRSEEAPAVIIPGQSAQSKPRMTLGACYDPETKLTRQHFSGLLTGMTLLTGGVEDSNRVRCISVCGEGLHSPNVLKILESGSYVKLESNAISITAQNLNQIERLMADVSYARPHPGVSANYSPSAVQSRILELSATYQCNKDYLEVPSAQVQLNVQPLEQQQHHVVVGERISARDLAKLGHASFWSPETEPLAAPVTPESLESAVSTGSKPPGLIVEGPDRIIVEAPIAKPGIQLFPEIRFSLPEESLTSNAESLKAAARAVPIDACRLWTEQGSPSKAFDQFDWSRETANRLGLSTHIDSKGGVAIKGRRTAEAYADLLETIHFLPSPEEEASATEAKPVMIGLVCSLDAGTRMTSQFITEVVIRQPTDSLDGVQNDQQVDYDYPEPKREEAQVDKSDEAMPNDDKEIGKASKDQQKSSFNAATIVIPLLIIMGIGIVVLTAVVVYKKRKLPLVQPYARRQETTAARRRFARPPADFGGSRLKQDPVLRLTANPIEHVGYVQGARLTASSPLNVSLPHIYSPPVYRSTKVDVHKPNRGVARLAEFDDDCTTDVDVADHASTLSGANDGGGGGPTTTNSLSLPLDPSEALNYVDDQLWSDNGETGDDDDIDEGQAAADFEFPPQ